MPSMSTLFSLGNARTMVPLSPRFLPAITNTSSPFFNFICVFYVLRSIYCLNYLRRERADALISAFDYFARDGTEDTARLGFKRVFAGACNEYDGILVEADVGAVLAAVGLGLTDDDRAVHFLLLHGFAGLGGLNGDDNHVAQFCVALLGAAENFEHTSDLTAGVVCYFDEAYVLQRCLGDRDEDEILALGNRTRLFDGHFVAHLRGISGIVHEELLGEAHVLLVFRVLHVALHRDGSRVFHRRFHDDAFKCLSLCSD